MFFGQRKGDVARDLLDTSVAQVTIYLADGHSVVLISFWYSIAEH